MRRPRRQPGSTRDVGIKALSSAFLVMIAASSASPPSNVPSGTPSAAPEASPTGKRPSRMEAGTVTRVADGDTVTVGKPNQATLWVRLDGVDAPAPPKTPYS
jgi:endonuclease YncB( thermonuclease family)